jgi:hypothetical protein
MELLDILSKTPVPERIGLDEDDNCCDEGSNWISKIYEEASKNNITISEFHGASQICIYDSMKHPVVYKFPISYYFYYSVDDEYYTEDLSEDYVDRSVMISKDIKAAGMEQYFALMELAGVSVNGKPIYMQEFVEERYHNEKKHPSKDSFEKVSKINSDDTTSNPFDNLWAADFIEIYGEEKFLNLLKFIEENDIRDLHSSNYGWTAEGLPKIFDYASFFG